MSQSQQSRRKAILAAGFISFILIAVASGLLCFTYSEYEIQSILDRQHDLQQTVLEKSMDAIGTWRMELVNQSRFISSSEMFRMFITDTRDLPPERLLELSEPDAMHSDDEGTRALAEQRAYMQDLLKDFVRRRAWNSARIVTVDGHDILAPEFTPPLTLVQKELVEAAANAKSAIFGPIRQTKDGFFMDMVDPLFEVLGADEPKCEALLLLTVPMDKPLATFLSNPSAHESVIQPRIVDKALHEVRLIMFRGTRLNILRLSEPFADGNLPFHLRPTLASMSKSPAGQGGEAYSLGAEPPLLNWLFVVETPAEVIDDLIHTREWQIYGLGALATIGLTLLAAFIFAQITSRQYKARATHLANLYKTINQQKLILDGVNKSLEVGLLLVDDKGFIQVDNQAFRQLSDSGNMDLKGVPLVDVLPASASIDLIGKMKNVIAENKSATVEITLPGSDKKDHLYRVSLFPYESEPGESSSSGSGCVATFQDITLFRANAKKAMQRQEALLTAMDRALESVDHNLVGQSTKMAAVSKLLADKLDLDAAQKETLRIASLLSQIGKLFVPRELLLKKEKLTPEEKGEVARAPEHADRILRDLHFDLPVRETVREMGERLDGSGPAGMKGSDISRAGRLLAAVNAFIAMTSPRAWRASSGMNVQEAISALRGDARFDQEIIDALSQLDADQLVEAIGKN